MTYRIGLQKKKVTTPTHTHTPQPPLTQKKTTTTKQKQKQKQNKKNKRKKTKQNKTHIPNTYTHTKQHKEHEYYLSVCITRESLQQVHRVLSFKYTIIMSFKYNKDNYCRRERMDDTVLYNQSLFERSDVTTLPLYSVHTFNNSTLQCQFTRSYLNNEPHELVLIDFHFIQQQVSADNLVSDGLHCVAIGESRCGEQVKVPTSDALNIKPSKKLQIIVARCGEQVKVSTSDALNIKSSKKSYESLWLDVLNRSKSQREMP